MTNKFKVVMIPTNQKVNFACGLQPNGVLKYCSSLSDLGIGKPQDLYILSDEKIKEGDWFLSAFGSYPLHNVPGGYYEYPSDLSAHKKIVATTDKSLLELTTREVGGFSGHVPLPQLSESFIQDFIKTYNEGKPMTEVELEMVKCCGRCIEGLDECQGDVVKTSLDNTVIIAEAKVYSRIEVERLLKIALEDSCKYMSLKDFTDTHL